MTELPEAFYLPIGENTFESTRATSSPWDETMQHGGPPAGLLARTIEQARPDPEMPIARISVDMLGGIPQGTIRTEARIVRPGKRVEMVEASLWVQDRLAVTATAWRIRTSPGATRSQWRPQEPAEIPGECVDEFFDGVSPEWGYGRAIDWRFVKGGYNELGPGCVWTRLRIPLVAGEETGPVQRMLVVADSANGLSGELPLKDWLFIPPTMTATIQRPPESEWMLLDAHTEIGPNGTGLTQAEMHDERGLVAGIAQPLLVARRG
ncbi:MAG: thioesterase family protein [Nocardioides sp.]|nr:thioesterase family protein [Nocardioides sp.]